MALKTFKVHAHLEVPLASGALAGTDITFCVLAYNHDLAECIAGLRMEALIRTEVLTAGSGITKIEELP